MSLPAMCEATKKAGGVLDVQGQMFFLVIFHHNITRKMFENKHFPMPRFF